MPEKLAKQLHVGMVVSIPFGKEIMCRKGYVIALTDKATFEPSRIKEIEGICAGEETTESRLIALAAWMREVYGSTMIQALKTVLPIRGKGQRKEIRRVCLAMEEEQAKALLKEWEGSRYKARIRLLKGLLAEKSLEYKEAVQLGMSAAVKDYFLEQGIARIKSDLVYRSAVHADEMTRQPSLPLTPEQQQAVEIIEKEWSREFPRPVLLHGVTGSGKTRVYMEMIERVLKAVSRPSS